MPKKLQVSSVSYPYSEWKEIAKAATTTPSSC